jgi:hypothetical protein
VSRWQLVIEGYNNFPRLRKRGAKGTCPLVAHYVDATAPEPIPIDLFVGPGHLRSSVGCGALLAILEHPVGLVEIQVDDWRGSTRLKENQGPGHGVLDEGPGREAAGGHVSGA